MSQQSSNQSTSATTTTVSMNSLKVGELYKIKTIPKQTKYYVFDSEKKDHQKMQKKYYQYWFSDEANLVFREYPYRNTKFARDMDMEISIHKDAWKNMTFTSRSLVRERAKEFYTIRKIYEQMTNECGQLGTGPLDLIREMLGKV